MPDVVISVENLSKRYLVGHQSARRERYTALRDVIGREARNFVRKAGDFLHGRQIVQGDEVEEFWALKDVSFEVRRGEVLGIIGRNGAGKSTLLKVLSRITEPTKGRAVLRGRVASLLEVGTGFNPELTGRENIYLNGAILGMSRAEIRRKFDEIVEFAEIVRFLDTPVKHYSSGMYVRLAFAIAAHLEPEILVVDEVLAVGDVGFQQKCLNKMEAESRSGRTVLFVSHNMTAVERLCSEAIVLDKGQIAGAGSVQKQIRSHLIRQIEQVGRAAFPRELSNTIALASFRIEPDNVKSGEEVVISMRLTSTVANRVHEIALLFFNQQGVRIAIADLRSASGAYCVEPDSPLSLQTTIRVSLVEGIYFAGLYLQADDCQQDFHDIASLNVQGTTVRSGPTPFEARWRGFVELDYNVRSDA